MSRILLALRSIPLHCWVIMLIPAALHALGILTGTTQYVGDSWLYPVVSCLGLTAPTFLATFLSCYFYPKSTLEP